MTLQRYCEWLASTRGSIALHESLYAYPVVESVHVLTICLFVGMTVFLDLRLLGWTLRHVSVAELAGRLLPWMVAGFVVMVITGGLLFSADPVRAYHNVFFRVKMAFLLLAGLNALLFRTTVYRRVHVWGSDPATPRRARLAGAASLVLWSAIVVAGRMIAYNWFDCDQPQAPVVRWVAGCSTPTH